MMKKICIQQGRFLLILVLQINLFSFTCAQDPGKQDLLVAPIPELLSSEAGLSAGSTEQWEDLRRGEVLELFREHVYGRVPLSDLSISHRLVFEDREALQGKAIQKEVVVELSMGTESMEIPILIFLPKNKEQAVPLFLGLNFYGNQSIHPDTQISITDSWVRNNEDFGIIDYRATDASRGIRASRWPLEMILSRGYGLATI